MNKTFEEAAVVPEKVWGKSVPQMIAEINKEIAKTYSLPRVFIQPETRYGALYKPEVCDG